jgi:GNAT superfamily N-acetyltransferase
LRAHRRDEFDCGVASLNEWLHRYSGQNRRRNTAATWVITDEEDRVVAYATLSMTSIDRSAAPRHLGKGAPARVPALLVGRLAVNHRVAGYGLGTSLVRHILAVAVSINSVAACRAVVVDAVNADAYRWWQRFGFAPLEPDDESNRDLYVLTGDIQRTIEEIGER